MITFDDIQTDTVETTDKDIATIADMVYEGQVISCKRLVVSTELGAFEVSTQIDSEGLEIMEANDE